MHRRIGYGLDINAVKCKLQKESLKFLAPARLHEYDLLAFAPFHGHHGFRTRRSRPFVPFARVFRAVRDIHILRVAVEAPFDLAVLIENSIAGRLETVRPVIPFVIHIDGWRRVIENGRPKESAPAFARTEGL